MLPFVVLDLDFEILGLFGKLFGKGLKFEELELWSASCARA